jgi:hypothetical protein
MLKAEIAAQRTKVRQPFSAPHSSNGVGAPTQVRGGLALRTAKKKEECEGHLLDVCANVARVLHRHFRSEGR